MGDWVIREQHISGFINFYPKLRLRLATWKPHHDAYSFLDLGDFRLRFLQPRVIKMHKSKAYWQFNNKTIEIMFICRCLYFEIPYQYILILKLIHRHLNRRQSCVLFTDVNFFYSIDLSILWLSLSGSLSSCKDEDDERERIFWEAARDNPLRSLTDPEGTSDGGFEIDKVPPRKISFSFQILIYWLCKMIRAVSKVLNRPGWPLEF